MSTANIPLLSLQDGRDRGRVGQGVGGRGEMGGGGGELVPYVKLQFSSK